MIEGERHYVLDVIVRLQNILSFLSSPRYDATIRMIGGVKLNTISRGYPTFLNLTEQRDVSQKIFEIAEN